MAHGADLLHFKDSVYLIAIPCSLSRTLASFSICSGAGSSLSSPVYSFSFFAETKTRLSSEATDWLYDSTAEPSWRPTLFQYSRRFLGGRIALRRAWRFQLRF